MNMPPAEPPPLLSCAECVRGAGLGFDFTMAFQPIIDLETSQVFAQEALVRGLNQEPASYILSQINPENRYRFDQACRAKAIQLAAHLPIGSAYLSINFLPNAIYRPETCIRATLEAAKTYHFPQNQIMFEFTEGERIENHQHLIGIIREYQRLGFKTAIDDFGAGYAGLNLLAEFQPDIIKLDMALTRHINQDKVRRSIVLGILSVSRELNCEVIAEGIETYEELMTLREAGIHLFQGYYFARPTFEGFADLHFSPALN
ncbi:MAG: EAL domain-containing protein [Cyanobacteriota bacterium]|nr:EAL domain-containing protein [Cyanobacteriota bacterium]